MGLPTCVAIIYLGERSPVPSSSLPEGCRRARRSLTRRRARVAPRQGLSLLLGLCSRWGCLAVPVTRHAGGLLHHLFTLTATGVARGSRYVSVALSAGRPARGLPGIAPYGVRTFLGLAACAAGPRPPRPTQAFNVCRHLWYRGVGSRQCQDGAGLPHSVPARQNDTHSSPCEVPEPSQGLRTLECANSRTSSQGAETLRSIPRHFLYWEET